VTPLRFIETNILVRQITRDGDLRAKLTDELLFQIARGEVEGLVSLTVLFETAYVLEKVYQMDRAVVSHSVRRITGVPGIRIAFGEASLLLRTLELYTSLAQLSFADCYHAVLSLEYCNGEIYTFDKEFSRVPGITRLEPGASS